MQVDALPSGARIGVYSVVDVLGAGGFGITYKARLTKEPHTVVAIKEFYPRELATRRGHKVLIRSQEASSDFVDLVISFVNEGIKLRDQIQHPNIVRVIDILTRNKTCYIVMDYIDGVTLETYCRQRQLSAFEACALMMEILGAVDYLHSIGGMHRDLSPNNIMVTHDWATNSDRPVLIDFGASADGIDTERRQSSLIVANLNYAPPEQLISEGIRIHGAYTDIFAIGGIFYRMIAGTRPVDAITRLSALAKGEPDPLPTLSEAGGYTLSQEFLWTLHRCLALDPAARPQSIAELRWALGIGFAPEIIEITLDPAREDTVVLPQSIATAAAAEIC